MTQSPVGSAILRTIENLHGPAGRLEALLNAGALDAPYAVLVCHPHPLGGGTMHNKVVYHAMKAFQSFGLPVLRIIFRGTELSEGEHDNGVGEQDDVRAALDWLDREFGLPILFAGFSFGSYVGLRACCGDPRVVGLVALGIPAHAEGRDYDYAFLRDCPQPKLFVSGDHDQYGPVAEVEAVVAQAREPKELVWISGADHFFASKLEDVRQAIRAWAPRCFPLLSSK
jgi:alpha/beta superfamily hydrolase